MKIPSGWHELTINQFQELLPSKFEGMNDISKVINEIMILSNEPYEEVAKLTNKDVDSIHSMVRDIHHMLFVGSDKEDIRIATEHYEHNHEQIKSWDES